MKLAAPRLGLGFLTWIAYQILIIRNGCIICPIFASAPWNISGVEEEASVRRRIGPSLRSARGPNQTDRIVCNLGGTRYSAALPELQA